MQLRSPSDQIRQTAFAATAATTAKTPFVENSKVWIAVNDADAATKSNHVYDSEVSGGAKATGEAWSVGQAIYWDNTAKNVTTTSSGNTLIGAAAAAVGSGAGETSGNVLLTGQVV